MSSKEEKTQVLLLYPKTGMDFGSTVAPPHALLAVAAPILKAGYKVRILDQRVEPITEEILKKELSGEPICVGISTMVGSQIYFALSLAETVRRITNGKVPIVWGGCQPSVVPEQTLENENVDYVVIGEGDRTLLEMVRAWEHKQPLAEVAGIMFKNGREIVRTPPRSLLDVEELLPVPWELVNIESYIHRDMYISDRRRVLDIGQTSRGCPFKCGFCSSATIRQRKWRAMSVDKSLNLIVDTVKRFKLDGFWLRDDEFYINRKRANAIFKGIIDAKIDVRFYTSGTRCDVFTQAGEEEIALMKRAGAHTLKFGAESGSQRILNLMQKGITVEQTIESNLRCKRHGIIPVFAFIVGYPTETFEDMNKTIDVLYQLKRDNSQAKFETIAIFTPLPGTPSWNLAVEHGLVSPESFSDWIHWLFDDYDLEGAKMPWFKTRKERMWVGNISYMSVLGNSLQHVVGSVGNPALRCLFKAASKPLSAYYRTMLSNKKYRFMPDLTFVRYLRNKIFYKSDYTFK
ncbi:MAG: B12-binding domain-containing radical SAM protein [Candidatus Omnitrophota bacterium]|nr:MAG: B12-binding domain-containing radical SAM protein [Candidatus Omnitrophota bacterium]